MGILFNRFIEVRFPASGMRFGGRQELLSGKVLVPPSIAFDITHSSESDPNQAKITLYNLSPETQRAMLVEGARIEVEAGYWPDDGARETGVIFSGQIRKAMTSSESGVETTTDIECGDGDDGFSRARVRRNFGRATHTTVTAAIVEAFRDHGIKPGRIDIPAFTESRSRTIDRGASAELDDICRQHDLTWSIQDGVLNVWPRDEALRKTGYLLGPDTGVIGAPQFSDGGVELQTLMLPDIRPGTTFTLRNDHVTARAPGQFMVQEVNFSGDNFGGEFGCRITARTLTGGTRVRRSRERLQGAKT